MKTSDIMMWAAGVGVATASKLEARANTCQAIEPTECPFEAQSPAGVRCGVRGTLDKTKVNVIQPTCTGGDLTNCAQQCYGTRGCKSFAYNPKKTACTLYGSNLKTQGFTKTGTGRTKFYSSQCFAETCPSPPQTPTPSPPASVADGPNVVANGGFADGDANWEYEDGDGASDGFCDDITTEDVDGNYLAYGCAANAGYADVIASQQLSNIDQNANYALSFSLGYDFRLGDPAAPVDSTPTFGVYLDDIQIGEGSVCTPGYVNLLSPDPGCSTAQDGNKRWSNFGPYPVSSFSDNPKLRFEFTQTNYHWATWLDAVDMHTVG